MKHAVKLKWALFIASGRFSLTPVLHDQIFLYLWFALSKYFFLDMVFEVNASASGVHKASFLHWGLDAVSNYPDLCTLRWKQGSCSIQNSRSQPAAKLQNVSLQKFLVGCSFKAGTWDVELKGGNVEKAQREHGIEWKFMYLPFSNKHIGNWKWSTMEASVHTVLQDQKEGKHIKDKVYGLNRWRL